MGNLIYITCSFTPKLHSEKQGLRMIILRGRFAKNQKDVYLTKKYYYLGRTDTLLALSSKPSEKVEKE